MLEYVEPGPQHNALAAEVDQLIHPKEVWPVQLAHQGLRRYTEWRSYITNGKGKSDEGHRRMVRYFVDQLRHRIDKEPEHTPLRAPVVEIGFTDDPGLRTKHQRHHESSNYLRSLAQAMFENVYPGDFRLDQHAVFACFQPIHAWLSEIALTQLGGGYIRGGGGFSHKTAGRSNNSAYENLSVTEWDYFFGLEVDQGKIEGKVSATWGRAKERLDAQKERSRKRKEHQDARLAQVKAKRVNETQG